MKLLGKIKSYIKIELLLLVPIIVFLLFLLTITDNIITIILETGSLIVLSSILLCILFIIDFKSKKVVYYLLYSLLTLIIFIRISFIIRYNTSINASAFFIFFETNKLEAKSFLATYFTLKTYLVGILLCLPYFFKNKINYILNKHLLNNKLSIKSKLIFVSIAILSVSILNYKFSRQDFFINLYTSYNDYKQFNENKKHTLSSKLNKNINILSSPKEPQTNVIIIGESLSNWHMQLYNYHRKTNPKLTQIKNELLVFDDVISPHAHTQSSLNKILTLGDNKDKYPKKNSSIVQLANKGGYKTFWLSNQNPIGLYETLPTIISNASNYSKFIATDNQYYSNYDEKLLPLLDDALKDTSKLKTIFIHLMGNHMRYNLRYPESFSFYKKNKKYAQNIINQYDNSVLYNDYIVSTIIQRIKSKNIKSSVTYFSDHGEDVYDITDNYGHNEYEGTKPMFEIPFIFWKSKKYDDMNYPKGITKRKYILEDFYHSFSSIIGTYSEKYDSKKDIFSVDFIEKIRYIKKDINYEKK